MALSLQSRLSSVNARQPLRLAMARPASARMQGMKASAAVRPAAASRSRVTTSALFGFGAAKPAASAGAAAPPPALMICIDCGWIYDGKEDFKKLPSSFKCPVCTSPKSRFKVYKGTDVKGRPNNTGAANAKRKAAKQW